MAAFTLHVFDYLKGNSSKYFAESTVIWFWKPVPGGMLRTSLRLAKPICYYLGSYPNTWKRLYESGAPEEIKGTLSNFPIGYKPQVPDFPISEDEKEMLESLVPTYGKDIVQNYMKIQRMDEPYKSQYMEKAGPLTNEIDKSFDKLVTRWSKYNLLEYFALKRHMDERKARFDNCVKDKYPKTKAY